MKKIITFLALTIIFGFGFSKDTEAKTNCSVLPPNLQCWRSWCGFGQVKVCDSSFSGGYCYCYDDEEIIEEGECQGLPADTDNRPCALPNDDDDTPNCRLPNRMTGDCGDFISCSSGPNEGLCCETDVDCATELDYVADDELPPPPIDTVDEARCNTNGGPVSPASPGDGINTAIGCIPVNNTNEFAAFILRWALGIGSGIAFLLIIYAGFIITTSSGNPDRLKAGQELLTSAIMGLILLIFSVFILRIIGVNILRIF